MECAHRLRARADLSAQPDPPARQRPDRGRRRAAAQHFFQDDVTVLNPIQPVAAPARLVQPLPPARPAGNAEFGVAKPGFFGSMGLGLVDTGSLQHAKTPHLRNLYQKVGMFGVVPLPFLPPDGDLSATRATRSAASASCTTAAPTRSSRFLSVAAFSRRGGDRRLRLHGGRQPPRDDLEKFPDGLRQQHGADRRPADHLRPLQPGRRPGAGQPAAAAGGGGECEVVASTPASPARSAPSSTWPTSGEFVANEHGLPPIGDELWLRLAALVSSR